MDIRAYQARNGTPSYPPQNRPDANRMLTNGAPTSMAGQIQQGAMTNSMHPSLQGYAASVPMQQVGVTPGMHPGPYQQFSKDQTSMNGPHMMQQQIQKNFPTSTTNDVSRASFQHGQQMNSYIYDYRQNLGSDRVPVLPNQMTHAQYPGARPGAPMMAYSPNRPGAPMMMPAQQYRPSMINGIDGMRSVQSPDSTSKLSTKPPESQPAENNGANGEHAVIANTDQQQSLMTGNQKSDVDRKMNGSSTPESSRSPSATLSDSPTSSTDPFSPSNRIQIPSITDKQFGKPEMHFSGMNAPKNPSPLVASQMRMDKPPYGNNMGMHMGNMAAMTRIVTPNKQEYQGPYRVPYYGSAGMPMMGGYRKPIPQQQYPMRPPSMPGMQGYQYQQGGPKPPIATGTSPTLNQLLTNTHPSQHSNEKRSDSQGSEVKTEVDQPLQINESSASTDGSNLLPSPSPSANSMSSVHDEEMNSMPRTPMSPQVGSMSPQITPGSMQGMAPPSHLQTPPHAPPSSSKDDDRLDHFLYSAQFGHDPQRKEFNDKLIKIFESSGLMNSKVPCVAKQPVDLFRLYTLVKDKGGFYKVCHGKIWKEIASTMELNTSAMASYSMRKHYSKFLLAYECKYDLQGADPAVLLQQCETTTRKRNPRSRKYDMAKNDATKTPQPVGPLVPNGDTGSTVNVCDPFSDEFAQNQARPPPQAPHFYNPAYPSPYPPKPWPEAGDAMGYGRLPPGMPPGQYVGQPGYAGPRMMMSPDHANRMAAGYMPMPSGSSSGRQRSMYPHDGSQAIHHLQNRNGDSPNGKHGVPMSWNHSPMQNSWKNEPDLNETIPYGSSGSIAMQRQKMRAPGIKKDDSIPDYIVPYSKEATEPLLLPNARVSAVTLGPVEASKILMCLKSGLMAETTWALETLNVLLFDDILFQQLALGTLPGIVGLLLEHFEVYMKCAFVEFGSSSSHKIIAKTPKRKPRSLSPRKNMKQNGIIKHDSPGKKEIFKLSDSVKGDHIVCKSGPRKRKHSEDSLKCKSVSTEDESQLPKKMPLISENLSSLSLEPLLQLKNVNLSDQKEKEDPGCFNGEILKCLQEQRLRCHKKEFLLTLRDTGKDSGNVIEESIESNGFEKLFESECEDLCDVAQRALSITNIFRSFSSLPFNEEPLGKESELLKCFSRVLSFQHSHPIRERLHSSGALEPWETVYLSAIRENCLVVLSNIASKVNLDDFEESSVVTNLLDSLLHWLVCSSAYSIDPVPGAIHSTISMQRLSLETLCKMSLAHYNADYILATPPSKRIDSTFELLIELVGDSSQPATRELALVLLSNLAKVDTGVAFLSIRQHFISKILNYLQDSIDTVSKPEVYSRMSQSFESEGVNLFMAKCCCNLLLRVAQTHPTSVQPYRRQILFLTSTEVLVTLDSEVGTILSNILFELNS